MSLHDRCLVRIDEVRQAATDPRSAYLMRTRLQRMLVTVARSVATDVGLGLYGPEFINVTSDASARTKRIAELCNCILPESQHFSQRSEALDARWHKSWESIGRLLDDLQRALTEPAWHERCGTTPTPLGTAEASAAHSPVSAISPSGVTLSSGGTESHGILSSNWPSDWPSAAE
jgi:hypothetical protein